MKQVKMKKGGARLSVNGIPLIPKSARDRKFKTVFAKAYWSTLSNNLELYYTMNGSDPVSFVKIRDDFYAANCFQSKTHCQCTVRKDNGLTKLFFTFKTGAKDLGSVHAA